MTNDCFDEVTVTVKVKLTIRGEAVNVDFTGSDPQIRGFKNSSVANTYSAVALGLISYFDADLPRNEGTMRSVSIVAPYGSIVNPKPPAPVTMRTA